MSRTASEMTMAWVQKNPEKAKALRENYLLIKRDNREEAMSALKKTKYKTPMKAIWAYCRQICTHSTSRASYLKAPVKCKKKKCPLFPFRNTDPIHVKQGLKPNNIFKKVSKKWQK